MQKRTTPKTPKAAKATPKPPKPKAEDPPAAWEPRVYQATTPTAPCRAARPDRPGRTDCCRFAAQGGRFGDGRRRRGPLTWGGAEGI